MKRYSNARLTLNAVQTAALERPSRPNPLHLVLQCLIYTKHSGGRGSWQALFHAQKHRRKTAGKTAYWSLLPRMLTSGPPAVHRLTHIIFSRRAVALALRFCDSHRSYEIYAIRDANWRDVNRERASSTREKATSTTDRSDARSSGGCLCNARSSTDLGNFYCVGSSV